MVAFNTIPNDIRTPFVAVEIDSSQSQQGPSLLSYKALLIGQKLAGGAAAANSLVKVSNENQVIAAAGRGSMLHREYIGWSAVNTSTELWLGVLVDDAGGTAATGTIKANAAATADGVIPLFIGGVYVPVFIASGTSANGIATAIAAAITAKVDLPVTAAAATDTVTLTFRHKGTVGNSLDIRYNYLDNAPLPAGVTLTVVAMGTASAGATDPALATLIANMADMWFEIWAHPYTATTPLAAIEAELDLRFGPMRQQSGVAFTSLSGTLSTLTTLGTARNSKNSSIVAQSGAAPLTPPMEFAAETAAIAAYYGAIDPARPFQTLQYKNAKPLPETDQWSVDERNLLLHDGIATSKRGPGGTVQVDRLITTYQLSPAGSADTAYLDVNRPLTLLYLRYDFVNMWQTEYPRHKLADDDVLPLLEAGQAVVTPALGRARALLWFRDMEKKGLVEGYEQFKRDLVVARSEDDPNTLEFLLPPDLMDALIVTKAQLQFRQ